MRRNACHALSAIGRGGRGPPDRLAAGGAAEHERAEAAETLGDIGLAARPAIPALTGRLRDESPQVRAQAAEALGTIAQTDAAAAPALAETLGDESDLVRRNAAFALVRLGPHAEAAIPALGDVLYDEDRYVRGDAAQALLRIGTRQALGGGAAVPRDLEVVPPDNEGEHLLGPVSRTCLGPRAVRYLPLMANPPVTIPHMEVCPCSSLGSCSAPLCLPSP